MIKDKKLHIMYWVIIMDEVEMALLRHKKRKEHNITEKDDKKISKIFTKILLSIILVLGSTIYIKLSPENLENFKSTVLESNLTFTKINEWYHDVFGTVLPSVTEPDDSFVSNTDPLANLENYNDGYKVSTSKNSTIEALQSGLFVFQGEKEGYGNVYIIQGVNGIDIWYGNIQDTSLKLYDYIESGTILGTTQEDYYYLAFVKDGNFITYEEYQNQI